MQAETDLIQTIEDRNECECRCRTAFKASRLALLNVAWDENASAYFPKCPKCGSVRMSKITENLWDDEPLKHTGVFTWNRI